MSTAAGIMTTAPEVTRSETPPGCTPGGQWMSLAGAGFSKYEVWSAGGYGLDEDQWPVRHKTKRTRLKVTLGTHGYPQVKPYNDEGVQKTPTVHSLILFANVGRPKRGQETRHLNSDPLDYRWAPGGTDEEIKKAGGNLRYGSGPENHADQVSAGTASPPPATFPCVNQARAHCDTKVASPTVRCEPCRIAAGEQAARMLHDGMPLAAVTKKVGYAPRCYHIVHALARQYGGYRGTLAQAQAQHQPLLRRLLSRFKRGSK